MAYIYRHIRLDKNEPFYIGIGDDENYKRAYSLKGRNPFWKRVVNKSNYEVEIIEDLLTREEAIKKEAYWINFYGRRNLKEGPLVNITSGGDGGDTISKNPNKKNILKKWSKASKGKNNPNYGGKFHTPEYIQKQIASNSRYTFELINTETGTVQIFLSENQISKHLNIPRSTINWRRKAGKKIAGIYLIIQKDIV